MKGSKIQNASNAEVINKIEGLEKLYKVLLDTEEAYEEKVKASAAIGSKNIKNQSYESINAKHEKHKNK